MYNSQDIAIRIKETAKTKNIKLKNMLEECGLGINTISHMAKGQVLSSDSLYEIAEYLKVSVDYLLGRTDNPDLTNFNSYSNILNLPFNNQLGNGSSFEFNISPQQLNDNKELLELINKLSLVERSELILTINNILKEKGK